MLADNDVRITLLHRSSDREARRTPRGALQVEGANTTSTRMVDTVVIEHGTGPGHRSCTTRSTAGRSISAKSSPPICWRCGRSRQCTTRDGRFVLYRIGDAVASRNIPAAILDAYRLCNAI